MRRFFCSARNIARPVSLTVKLWPLTGSNTKPLSLTASLCRLMASGRIVCSIEGPGTVHSAKVANANNVSMYASAINR